MKVSSADSFGEIIKKRRKKMGYTQKYICEASGISASGFEEAKGFAQRIIENSGYRNIN